MPDIEFSEDNVLAEDDATYIRISNFLLARVGDIITHPAFSYGEFYGNGIFSVINPDVSEADTDNQRHLKPQFQDRNWVVINIEWVHECQPKWDTDYHWYKVWCRLLSEDNSFDPNGQVMLFIQRPGVKAFGVVNKPELVGKMSLPSNAALL